jgi:tetratricopeptide (TPR) repeat protein
MLLAKGDPAGAIAKLGLARQRAPRLADIAALWAEALITRGDYDGAARKFAEADRNAPRWGRNHLRWGEALMLAGRYREARAQFETANGMDLSAPDRAALKVLLARTASGPLHG